MKTSLLHFIVLIIPILIIVWAFQDANGPQGRPNVISRCIAMPSSPRSKGSTDCY